MKHIMILLLVVLSGRAFAVCSGYVQLASLKPRAQGWVHVVAEGVTNIDISNCGVGNYHGLLLNYNDSSNGQTLEGKKMIYTMLLSAYMAGRKVNLCSTGCDSQYPTYSRLDHIDGIQ